MAKVDKITAEFQGKHQSWEVHFNTKQGFFIKDCPPSVLNFGEFENRADKLDELKTRFYIARIKTEKEILTSRRVILVRLTITYDTIAEKNQYGSQSIDNTHPLARFTGGSSFQNMEGIGFAIDYQEAIEVDRGEELAYYRPGINDFTDRRNGRIYKSDNDTPIPYSEQAIENLNRIQAQLRAMINQVAGLFLFKDQLQTALESNTFLKLNP